MSLISSTVALRALAALTQRGRRGATLREVATAAGVGDSTAQHAVALLAADAVVGVSGRGRQRRYRLEERELTSDLLRLAGHYVAPEQLLGALVRANPAVEFAGLDDDGLLVVFRERSTAVERLLLREAFEPLGLRTPLASFRHDDLVERLAQRPVLRERALRSKILVGDLARSFPDRRRRGALRDARPLGRAHPSLRLPSLRALRRIARRFGLEELRLFGSSVRADFRADSDVDVLVRPRPGARLRIADLVELEDALEDAFDRDVDIVTPEALAPAVRPRVEREAVALYG